MEETQCENKPEFWSPQLASTLLDGTGGARSDKQTLQAINQLAVWAEDGGRHHFPRSIPKLLLESAQDQQDLGIVPLFWMMMSFLHLHCW